MTADTPPPLSTLTSSPPPINQGSGFLAERCSDGGGGRNFFLFHTSLCFGFFSLLCAGVVKAEIVGASRRMWPRTFLPHNYLNMMTHMMTHPLLQKCQITTCLKTQKRKMRHGRRSGAGPDRFQVFVDSRTKPGEGKYASPRGEKRTRG